MGWFRRKASNVDDTAKVVEVLYRGCVEDRMDTIEPGYFAIPDALCAAYVAKAHTYRQATLLFALLGKNQNDSRYEPIVRACEALIFPPEPSTEGLRKLEIIKEAMRDIAELVDPSNERKLTWSAKWLSSIGYHNPNITTVALFGIAWMDYYIATRNIVDRMVLP